MGIFTTEEIEEYLKRVIVSRFNDHLGEHLDTLFNLPGRYEELSDGLQKRLQHDFSRFGIALEHLYITSITPPPEVQQAIDDKGRLGILQDLDRLIKMKAAMAMEKAAASTGTAGSGMGMGMGLMMPAMFAEALRPHTGATCPDCKNPVSTDARFCPHCGHQQLVFHQCSNCGKNMTPTAQFCPQCGHPADQKPASKACPHCKAENLPNAIFCNLCGEKLG
jgi:membrane protease subunit (stomatin/prohibitin family)